MRFLGALLVIFAVLAAWRCYSGFLSRELSHTRSFLRAIENYRERVRCYLETPASWAASYRDEELSRSGFLDAVARGEPLASAYETTRGTWCFTEVVDEALCLCFSHLGEGYLDSELEALGAAIEKLESEEARLSSDISRRRKVAGALLGAIAVGVVILAI